MRITNPMMTNKMMLNINRNTTRLNTLYTQQATWKKIQYPSENPIIASRALKFRTTVAENAQYQKNVEQGMSWMDVTEGGYTEITKILEQIRDLAVQGDGTDDMNDKKAMATKIQSLLEQMGLVMNNSYTGRYLFSGYRTDEPGVILQDSSSLVFRNIRQSFTSSDVEQIKAYQKLTATGEGNTYDVSILKLPYKNCTFANSATPPSGPDMVIDGVNVAVETKSSITDGDAYQPAAGEVYYIRETGELVLGSNFVGASDFSVAYDKTGFEKGDLNPKVYFECQDANGIRYDMNNQDIEYEFGVGIRFPINSLAKDVVTAGMYSDIMNFCDSILGMEVSDRTTLINALRADPANALKTDEEIAKKADEQIASEKGKVEAAMQKKFSNMIELIDKHSATLSRSQTDLGARGARLELVQNRLEADETAYRKLMSENEDVDPFEVAMLLKSAESVYQASLMAGMNMMQLSLANFL